MIDLFRQNMDIKNIFNIHFLLVFLSTTITAQEIKFEYITPNDGLSQSSVNTILQDRSGFMWFGTSSGLNRFDGSTFVIYYANVKDSASIVGNSISTLYEDKQGNIWVGTDNGISFYNRDHDNFINYRHKDNDPTSLSGLIVSSLYEDSKSRFWVGTLGGGLNIFDRESKKFKHYTHVQKDPKSLSSNTIHAIIEDRDGRIWIGTENAGLSLFNERTDDFINFRKDVANPESLAGNAIYALAKDKNGNIWVGTLGNGICKINLLPGGTYSFSNYKPITNDFQRLKVLTLYPDNSGGLWVGTENGGLDYFNVKNNTFTNYHTDKSTPNCLNNNSIHAIYKDKTSNLWVGTFTGGVNIVKKNAKKIQTYRNVPGNFNSLSYNAVTCFYEDIDGTFWIGTDGGGVNHWDRSTNKMTCLNSRNSSMKSDAVLTICKSDKDNIWIGGWECGLNLYNKKKRTVTTFTQERNGIPNNNIFDILVDKKDQLWVSFGGIGIGVYDKIRKSFKVYTTSNSNLPNYWVSVIREDFNGNILLGSTRGFTIFHPVSETFENYSHNDKDINSLSQNQVNTILVARDSTIWLGTVNGLNQFNPQRKNFTAYYTEDGLANNNVEGLVEDGHDHIWISTANGISDYDPQSKKFKNYKLADGLQGKNYIRNSCSVTSKNEVIFGGTNGFNLIQPDSLFDNPDTPQIVITGLSIFNRPVKVGEPGSPLTKNISQSDTLILSYNQSVFTFEYVALDYTEPDQNQYAYRLLGFENEWNYVGSRRTATYTNLDPGDYVFQIKGSNNDGKWNQKGVSLKITITPPFWKTWWFRFLILIVIGFLISFYVSLRTRSIKRNNLLLEKLVEQRTKELNIKNEILFRQANDLNETNVVLEERQQQIEEQAEELMSQKEELERVNIELNELNVTKDKFFSIIAHDIKNPFNTILGYSELLRTNFGKWAEEKKLQIVNTLYSSSKNIYELLENLLQWARSQRGAIDFIPQKYRLSEEINYVIMLLKTTADEKEIEIKFDNFDEDIFVNADIRMLHTILRNLVTNAIKFTKKEGLIQIQTGTDAENAIIKVIDNGVGISQDNLEKIFRIDSQHTTAGTNKERGTGLGLILSKEFVEKHGGKIWAESIEGKGSTVTFTIPLLSSS
jgi:signal transduction histidine kinase/ligand-binding sensor domain-containing protein